MRISLLFIAILVGLLLYIPQAVAKNSTVEIKVKTIIGKILILDAKAGQLTVRVNDLAETIRVSPECKFGDNQDDLNALTELKVGEQIIATCVDDRGSLTAHRIRRLKPKPKK